jgi:alkylation response protein AidB-like acyl-CoA dehydrogenase
MKWANQRKVFGRPLRHQPVIRHKLAMMVAKVEAVQAWLEQITYQMTKMSYKQQSIGLAGPVALLKLLSTRVGTFVSDESCQVRTEMVYRVCHENATLIFIQCLFSLET